MAVAVLEQLAACDPGRSITPEAVARGLAETRRRRADPPDLWRRYLPSVRQQALHLARQGRITILRKGKPADPHAPIKGVVRLAPKDPEADGS